MKILFIVPYPKDEAPSQRFRFEQYYQSLKAAGHYTQVQPFLSLTAWKSIYISKNLLEKGAFVLLGYLKRFLILRFIHKFDYVFIHREASPAGPPFFEWCIAKIFRKKIIYDFDDAIWLTDHTNESWLIRKIRWRSKVSSICKWSDKISCGNSYLAEYAKQFNKNVFINPTTIDTLHMPIPKAPRANLKEKITIGWTGSHSTLKYLKTLLSVLQRLEKKYPEIKFLVIADEDPKFTLKNLTFIRWKKESEIADLENMDIGLMPLPDGAWSKGKCGFKALQYMALEIPALVSPVGVNTEIVVDGIHGYWCASEIEWFTKIENLIIDHEKRSAMGKMGRQKVIERYSVASNSANFLSLFQ